MIIYCSIITYCPQNNEEPFHYYRVKDTSFETMLDYGFQ